MIVTRGMGRQARGLVAAGLVFWSSAPGVAESVVQEARSFEATYSDFSQLLAARTAQQLAVEFPHLHIETAASQVRAFVDDVLSQGLYAEWQSLFSQQRSQQLVAEVSCVVSFAAVEALTLHTESNTTLPAVRAHREHLAATVSFTQPFLEVELE